MDSGVFDGLVRLLDRSGPRRPILGALLGTAVVGFPMGSIAAKRTSYGKKKKSRTPVRAEAKTKPGNHCISPSGVDLNDVFDISAQIVAQNQSDPPFFQGCDEVGAGERWTVAQQVWAVAQTCTDVPVGFACTGGTPLADFLAKFEGVKFVIDPGTRRQRTTFLPTSDALTVNDVDEEVDVVSATTLGTLKPLPVGPHVVEVYWVFKDMHCDGLGPNPTLQCFRPGENLFNTVAFRVTPGHN